MRTSSRAVASVLGLALSLTACGGHSMPLPAVSDTGAPATDSAVRGTGPSAATPLISVPKTFGALAFQDAGRRDPHAPVSVSLVLRYNHQAELDRFVAELAANHSRNPLTREEFNAKYAPTERQEATVVRELERAGFTVTQRFPNRTVVDAKAPNAVVERFFGTLIHNVHQGKYGERYANVAAATVPASIAPIVRDVSLNNLVIARTRVDEAGGIRNTSPAIPGDKPSGGTPSQEMPGGMRPMAAGCTGNLFLNPGFESGNVDWSSTANVINNDSSLSYQGSWEAWLDGYSSPETDTLSQTVTIPYGLHGDADVLSLRLYDRAQQRRSGRHPQAHRERHQQGFVLEQDLDRRRLRGRDRQSVVVRRTERERALDVEAGRKPGDRLLHRLDRADAQRRIEHADAVADGDSDREADGDADGLADGHAHDRADGHADRASDGHADDGADRDADHGSHSDPGRQLQRRGRTERAAHQLFRYARHGRCQTVRLPRAARLQRRR